MVRYKTIAKDVDTNPTHYRTWVTEDSPDLVGTSYDGARGGTNPFVDTTVNMITDNGLVVDFNLPQPENWASTKRTLPEAIYDSQLAVIGEYIYLFGSKNSNKIYKAHRGRPADWQDTGSTLPNNLHGSHFAIIEDGLYLFGGSIDGVATNSIYYASFFNPLSWTIIDGYTLPGPVSHGQLCISDSLMYLLGGQNNNGSQSHIFMARIDEPLLWTDGYISLDDGYTYPDGYSLSEPLYGSHLALILPYAYLFGGLNVAHSPISTIYRARLDKIDEWSAVGTLPSSISFGQFITIGQYGYIYHVSHDNNPVTRIIRCNLASPLEWEEISASVPGTIFQGNSAIINDRLLLIGGSGNSAIFADNPKIHYDYRSEDAVEYGDVTRTQYSAITNKLDLIKVLGFPYWRTDYKDNAPMFVMFARFSFDSSQLHTINVTNEEFYKINWGDGQIQILPAIGSRQYVTHGYVGTKTQKWYVSNTLDNLKEFICSNNNLTGNIYLPSGCRYLSYFDCSYNYLEDNIDSIATNTGLEHFDCSHNQFSGDLPALVSNLALEHFDCSYNLFTNTIPSLSDNENLLSFYCSNNSLTGSIPSLDDNVDLINFDCHNNSIDGYLPSLNNNVNLEYFDCSDNIIEGSIPLLSNNTNLQYFDCSDNLITEYQNSTLSTTLTYFNAYNCYLTTSYLDQILANFITNLSARPTYGYIDLSGVNNGIPSTQGITDKLTIIDYGWEVYTNIPDPYILYATFQYDYDQEPYFWLDFNVDTSFYVDWGDDNSTYYTGTGSWQTLSHVYSSPGTYEIKLYVMSKDDIERVDLDSSYFKGQFPNFNGSSNLTEIYSRGDEEFYGNLDVRNCTSLQSLYMQYSGFVGSPGGNLLIENTPNLAEVYAQGNYFYGSLPDISGLTNLTDFEVIENNFTGNIPDLSGCTSLWYIDVSDNDLTGSIPNLPDGIGSAYFDNNLLSGTIPSLTDYTSLRVFSCANNSITDYTPSYLSLTLYNFTANNNNLPQSAIDQILADWATDLSLRTSYPSYIYYINLINNTYPSPAGMVNKATLLAKGWTVLTDEPPPEPPSEPIAISSTTWNISSIHFYITVKNTKEYIIDWGDGSSSNVIGTGLSQDNYHLYSFPYSTRQIIVYVNNPDDLLEITLTGMGGPCPDFATATSLERITFQNPNLATGSIPNFPNNVKYLTIGGITNAGFTGTFPTLPTSLIDATFSRLPNVSGSPNISSCPNLNSLTISSCPLLSSPSLSNTNVKTISISSSTSGGAIPDISGCSSLTGFLGVNNNSTSFTGSIPSSCTSYNVNTNLLNQVNIDAILAHVASSLGSRPTSGSLNLTGNAAPSAAGLVNKSLIEAHGWSVAVSS